MYIKKDIDIIKITCTIAIHLNTHPMNRFAKFTQALKPTSAEAEAEKRLKIETRQAGELIASGYRLGEFTSTRRTAEKQGLCLSFQDRLKRAVSSIWAAD